MTGEIAKGDLPSSGDKALLRAWNWLTHTTDQTDDRQLAPYYVGRFLLGIAMLYDWVARYPHRELWYAGYGALPRDANPMMVEGWHYSFFYISNSPVILTGLFLAWLAAILWFLTGYRPRTSAAVNLVFTLSAANANVFVGFCCDIYMALLLWLILMPPGDRRSAYFIGFLVQLGFIYTISGLNKITPGSEWTNGTALSVIGPYANITNGLGAWLGQLPLWMTKPFTWAALTIEVFALPGLLIPRTRQWTIHLLLGFHLVIALTMNIGELPIIMTAALVLALDERSKLGQWIRRGCTWIRDSRWGRWTENWGIPHGATQPRVALIVATYLIGVMTIDAYNRLGITFLARWNIAAHRADAGQFNNYLQGFLGNRQSWTMYASPLPQTIIWPVVHATTKKGEELDLLTGKKPSWEFPSGLAYDFDHREYKFWSALYTDHATSEKRRIEALGAFLVWDYNRRHPEDTLQYIGIWFGLADLNHSNVNFVKIW